MSRYIDVECDCVKEIINRRAFNSREDIQDFLDNIPTADVVPVKHGYWKNINGVARCSNCEYVPPYDRAIDDIFYSDYCPICGVKMDEGDNT